MFQKTENIQDSPERAATLPKQDRPAVPPRQLTGGRGVGMRWAPRSQLQRAPFTLKPNFLPTARPWGWQLSWGRLGSARPWDGAQQGRWQQRAAGHRAVATPTPAGSQGASQEEWRLRIRPEPPPAPGFSRHKHGADRRPRTDPALLHWNLGVNSWGPI